MDHYLNFLEKVEHKTVLRGEGGESLYSSIYGVLFGANHV